MVKVGHAGIANSIPLVNVSNFSKYLYCDFNTEGIALAKSSNYFDGTKSRSRPGVLTGRPGISKR